MSTESAWPTTLICKKKEDITQKIEVSRENLKIFFSFNFPI